MEFREEPIQQVMVQWVKLFPLVRLRVSEQRVIDRLDLILRNLHAKFIKMPKTSLIVAALADMMEKLRAPDF